MAVGTGSCPLSIENGLHYRRDETFREDRCRLTGQGAPAMAVLNNLVLGLLRRTGVDNLPDARRHYAANLEEAAALVLRSLAPVCLNNSRNVAA